MPIDNLSTVYTPKDTGSGQNVYGGLSQVFKPQKQTELDFTPLIADKQAKDKAERERLQKINKLLAPEFEETWMQHRGRLDKEATDYTKELRDLYSRGELTPEKEQEAKLFFERNNLDRKTTIDLRNRAKAFRTAINTARDKIDQKQAIENVDKFENPLQYKDTESQVNSDKYKGDILAWQADNTGLLTMTPKKKPFPLQQFITDNKKDLTGQLALQSSINPETGKKWTVTDAVTDKQAKEHVDYLYKQDPEFQEYINERYANEDYAKTFKSPSEFAQQIMYKEFTKQKGFREDETAQSRAKLSGDKAAGWDWTDDTTHNVTTKDGDQYNYNATGVRIIGQDADPINLSNTKIYSEETNKDLGSGSSDITVKKVYYAPTAQKDIYIDTKTGEKISPTKFSKAKQLTLGGFKKALPTKVKNRLIIDGKKDGLTEDQSIKRAFEEQAKLNKGRFRKIPSGQRIPSDVVEYLGDTDYSNEEWGHGVAKNKKFLETSPIKLTEAGDFLEDVKGNQYNKIEENGNVYAVDPSTNEKYLYSGGKIQAPAYGATAEVDVYFKAKDNEAELKNAFGEDFFKQDEETEGWDQFN